MSPVDPAEYPRWYARFNSPLTEFDCGNKCAPYNERGVPFCCDIQHAVPTAYQSEWNYLQANTDLWRTWHPDESSGQLSLQEIVPAGHVPIACLGHHSCQREFRSLTCRAFPFFPYLTRDGDFIGLTYYWEFSDRCWVISNLDQVTSQYREEFFAAFDRLFVRIPPERENFRRFSNLMRRTYGRRHKSIPILHRNGQVYKVTPRNGRLRRVSLQELPKFGVYKIAAAMPFPGEAQP